MTISLSFRLSPWLLITARVSAGMILTLHLSIAPHIVINIFFSVQSHVFHIDDCYNYVCAIPLYMVRSENYIDDWTNAMPAIILLGRYLQGICGHDIDPPSILHCHRWLYHYRTGGHLDGLLLPWCPPVCYWPYTCQLLRILLSIFCPLLNIVFMHSAILICSQMYVIVMYIEQLFTMYFYV